MAFSIGLLARAIVSSVRIVDASAAAADDSDGTRDTRNTDWSAGAGATTADPTSNAKPESRVAQGPRTAPGVSPSPGARCSQRARFLLLALGLTSTLQATTISRFPSYRPRHLCGLRHVECFHVNKLLTMGLLGLVAVLFSRDFVPKWIGESSSEGEGRWSPQVAFFFGFLFAVFLLLSFCPAFLPSRGLLPRTSVCVA